MARGWPIELRQVKGDHVSFPGRAGSGSVEFDVVWLRQDPPFDMGYLTHGRTCWR
jgi:glutathione synthase